LIAPKALACRSVELCPPRYSAAVPDDNASRAMESRLAGLLPRLNERDRRVALATEARSWGRGGIAAVHRATGASRSTIRRCLAELDSGPSKQMDRVRAPGGGRKKAEVVDPNSSQVSAAASGRIRGAGGQLCEQPAVDRLQLAHIAPAERAQERAQRGTGPGPRRRARPARPGAAGPDHRWSPRRRSSRPPHTRS
jgi:hypothetical protein